jgi:hypothetical protein
MNWNRRCHMLNDTKPCDAACGVLISNADMVHELSYQTMIYERHSIQLELDHWCSRIQPLFELVYPTCWKCLISPLFGHIRFLLGCCVCYHKLHYVNRLGVRQTLCRVWLSIKRSWWTIYRQRPLWRVLFVGYSVTSSHLAKKSHRDGAKWRQMELLC